MSTGHIWICHRSRLFGECLATALNVESPPRSSILAPGLLESLEASTAEERRDGLLILDASLIDDIPVDVLTGIRGAGGWKILVMVGDALVPQMRLLARFSCHGWLFEGTRLVDLEAAIIAVQSGHAFCSSELATAIIAQVGDVEAEWPHSGQLNESRLTAREHQILELISTEKLCNKQIARRLGVSLYTVKNHVHNLIQKLGVDDRHEAAQVVHRRHALVRTDREGGHPRGLTDGAAVSRPK